MKWHPVETAPRDGREVRLGWLPNGYLEQTVVSCWKDGHWVGDWTPTHWSLTLPE